MTAFQRSKVRLYLDNIASERNRGHISKEESDRLVNLVKEGLRGENVELPENIGQ